MKILVNIIPFLRTHHPKAHERSNLKEKFKLFRGRFYKNGNVFLKLQRKYVLKEKITPYQNKKLIIKLLLFLQELIIIFLPSFLSFSFTISVRISNSLKLYHRGEFSLIDFVRINRYFS